MTMGRRVPLFLLMTGKSRILPRGESGLPGQAPTDWFAVYKGRADHWIVGASSGKPAPHLQPVEIYDERR